MNCGWLSGRVSRKTWYEVLGHTLTGVRPRFA